MYDPERIYHPENFEKVTEEELDKAQKVEEEREFTLHYMFNSIMK